MPRVAHPILAGIFASIVGVVLFEVAAASGFATARLLGFGSTNRIFFDETVYAILWPPRVPSLFLLGLLVLWVLLELLVLWATYRLLRKAGRFTLWWAVGMPAFGGVFFGLTLWLLLFGPIFYGFTFHLVVPVLAGVISWSAAGATFWMLAHEGRDTLTT